MKKNFSQPFARKPAIIHLLVEVSKNTFINFNHTDELGLEYYNSLSFQADESQDFVNQLAKFLFEQGLSINSYRELTREVSVGFSFIDESPGYVFDSICLYVQADRTVKFNNDKITSLTLSDTIDRFENAPDIPSVVKLGLAQLYNERYTLLS